MHWLPVRRSPFIEDDDPIGSFVECCGRQCIFIFLSPRAMSASISIPLIAAVSTSASRNVFQAAGVMRWPSRSPRSTAPRGMRRCRHSGNRRKQWTVAVGAPHKRTPIGNKPANRRRSRQVLRIARCGPPGVVRRLPSAALFVRQIWPSSMKRPKRSQRFKHLVDQLGDGIERGRRPRCSHSGLRLSFESTASTVPHKAGNYRRVVRSTPAGVPMFRFR